MRTTTPGRRSRPTSGMRRTTIVATAGLLGMLVLAPAGSAASPSPATSPAPFAAAGLTLGVEPFAEGLSSPVFVTGDRSGTGWLYALEQEGRIVAIAPDGTVATVPVLDITGRVTAGGEQGLLGLALHPDYRENGRLFVNYTRRSDGATRISEFSVRDDGTADPDSERVLLLIPQPYGNHNGGMIAFDADGMLLIGMGDGGSGGDPQGYGQSREALLGKMLRIDVDGEQPYAIPEDNPFYRDVETRPEIWAIGLRNPWRFSVDRATGDLWIGDVGQGAWEEVSVAPAGVGGLNLGWNTMEGDACFDAAECDATGLRQPVATISHADGACSVIGGHVYRGDAFPALHGGYVYTDLCTGDLYLLDAAQGVATGGAAASTVGTTDGSIVSFGEGDDGELFLVDQGGRVLRLVVTDPAG